MLPLFPKRTETSLVGKHMINAIIETGSQYLGNTVKFQLAFDVVFDKYGFD